jgi:hypothetical protein
MLDSPKLDSPTPEVECPAAALESPALDVAAQIELGSNS